MATKDTTIRQPRVVSHTEWITERVALLKKEKEATRLQDELSRRRRALPWVRVDKPYVFHGPKGDQTLAELFDGRSQLLVYHFMYGPEMKEGCPSCSFVVDHFDGMLPHLAARDVTLVVISRAPYPTLEAFKRRMGWRFTWVSSAGSDFNYDYGVSFTDEQRASGKLPYNYTHYTEDTYPIIPDLQGASVFARDGSEVFRTYSTYGRGVETFTTTYATLDMMPKGRDEEALDFPMAWVRYHDRYEAES
jgi:predicted dithiol-disulfide oxidoreductase (DUF899 family)